MSQVEAYTVDKELMIWSICITLRDSFNCIIYSHLLKLMQKTSFIGCRFETGEDNNNIKATKSLYYTIHVYF